MGDSGHERTEDLVERLRQALGAETQAYVEVRKQLDHANAEFEEFVSLAAHNLRESLRDVVSFSELLAEDAQNGLYLDRIQEGAASMQTLLTGVVDYWAMGAGGRQFSSTDMEGVMQQALLSTDKPIAERSAVVTHDPLPRVMGDFDILAKVLHHLLRNAIEYCAVPAPRVHVACRRADSDWVFSVADNGPGIAPEFQDRLFGVFKRLHGKEHPGNGLGLAFCKKAIEWHGGRMWMKSIPGEGSTFFFSVAPAD